MEIESRQLLNSLSDAIKECQLRFGGKRELATDIDGRVILLCQKLEAIFLHGLKKRSNSSSLIPNTTQFHNLANNIRQTNIIKNTGNLISQFFDEGKLMQVARPQDLLHGSLDSSEISFWPFIKCFMNRFDIDRYERLTHVKTNTGRQRSWLRSCLNEHCLERFTVAALANEHLINQFYEDWSFLLDKSCNSNLPVLISGLESILFAINIDTASLNIPSKITKSYTVSQIQYTDPESILVSKSNATKQQTASSLPNNYGEYEKHESALADATRAITLKSKKIKKNTNVIIFDNDGSQEESTSPKLTSPSILSSIKSSSNFEPKLGVELHEKSIEESIYDCISLGHNNLVEMPSPFLEEKNIEKESPSAIIVNDLSSDMSGDGITEKKFDICKCDDEPNLIPLDLPNSTNIENKFDSFSNKTCQSEASSEILAFKELTNESLTGYSTAANLKPNEINSLLKKMVSSRTDMNKSDEYDGLTLKEMREFVLTLIQRKDDLDEKYRKLQNEHSEQLIINKGLSQRIKQCEEERQICLEKCENKRQNLETENKLLKDQLKKYVSAVQLIRSNKAVGDNKSPIIANFGLQASHSFDQDSSFNFPSKNDNLQRDYSYEAEQYEKKLIQVAEMHGELMEFNSRLHKIINFKTMQVQKLKNELIELRGPLPAELTQEILDDRVSYNSEIPESTPNSRGSLINIWIPSVFMRTNQSDSYHVYQIYVRIKDEEWNIYRRFSHFHDLHTKLKHKYPIVATITFPKKKAIGNKDSKFVENRRKMLQEYLRAVVLCISQVDSDLNSKPCREILAKSIPFLSDQYFQDSNQASSSHMTNVSLANSLGHAIRTNTISASSNLRNGNEISTPYLTQQQSVATNEPLYTGL